MPGAGTKSLTTRSSPVSAHLLDVTRTVSRAGRRATGIDRVERAYLSQFTSEPTPCFGLLRTKLGYLLLDRDGCKALYNSLEQTDWPSSDLLSRITRRNDKLRAGAETALRKMAIARSTPHRLVKMLRRRMPEGVCYFNVGHVNLTDRVVRSVSSIPQSRIVTFVHDTIPKDHPAFQTSKSRLKFDRFFERAMHHSDLIVANSHATADDIRRHRDTETPQVIVCPPGLQDVAKLPNAKVAPDGPPDFVAVGTLEPRKGIGSLVRLWSQFSGPDDPHLVLCGARGWMSEDLFALLDNHPANIREENDLSDGELWSMVQNSAGLLFPSRAEGFGFPAIEAAALGVPVVCTPLPALKEVLGDYPIYVKADDEYLWRETIIKLAQRRRDKGGEQTTTTGAFVAPTWEEHFNRLFTEL